MCNYSDLIEEEAMEKGMEKGMERGKIVARYEDGMPPEEIARKMGLTLKQVEDVLVESKVLKMV